MPLPPLVRDYVTIGGTQPNAGTFYSYWTWAQVRVPVTAAQHTTGALAWGAPNLHAWDYIVGLYGIEAVDSEERLFRGIPDSVRGYNDFSTSTSPSSVEERFFFGFLNDDGTGLFVPTIAVGLDKEEESPILEYASFVGSGQTIGVEPQAYDGSDPNGQDIGSTPLGTVSTVTLSF